MLDNIVDLLQRNGTQYIPEKKMPVKGFTAGALGFSFGLTFTDGARAAYGFRVKLEMLLDRLDEVSKGVAILVDEVRPDSKEMHELSTTYQELAGEGKNLVIIMVGLPSAVSEVLGEPTLAFLNRATKVSLGAITISSVRSYYASAFQRADRSIDATTLDDVARATDGFPYLLQLLGYYLVSLSERTKIVDENVLTDAKELARADLDENVFKAMLRPLFDTDINFLKAMSFDDGSTKTKALEERLGVSQGHVQSYRKRLLEAGVITSPRRGELAFVVPKLASYLRRTDNL